MGYSWESALAAVFIEGVVFILLAVEGIIIGGVLVARKVKGALFYVIVAVTLLSIPLGIPRIPEGFSLVSIPHSLEPVFFNLDFHSLLSPNMLIAIFLLVFMDIFDTLGTLVGMVNKVGMVKSNGSIPKLKPAMMADAVGTTVGVLQLLLLADCSVLCPVLFVGSGYRYGRGAGDRGEFYV